MKKHTILMLAVFAFGAVVLVPQILSIGATSRLDSSSALAAGNYWVAAMIIFIIFRVFSAYVAMINDAARGF